MYMFMARKPENIIKDIKDSLHEKGYKKDIPLEIWYAEFMYQTGYGKRKIREWTENFELIHLISSDGKVMNFEN